MKNEESEKKAAAGCFVVMALFFLVLGVYQCNEEQQPKQKVKSSVTIVPLMSNEERQPEQKVKPSSSAPLTNTAPVRQKAKTTTSTFTPEDDEETDGDPYDNPDFDDLIPGEEYDEEFVDRDEGDPELYDEP